MRRAYGSDGLASCSSVKVSTGGYSGEGDFDCLAFLTGGGFSASVGISISPPSIDCTTSPSSPGRFLFLYFLFSGFGSTMTGSSLIMGFGGFPRIIGGGVLPPLAAFASASFCAFSLSLLSRVDMIPSLGGRPGPRFLGGTGWPSGPMIGSAVGGVGLSDVSKVILVLVFPVRDGETLRSCSFEVDEVLLCIAGLWSASSAPDSSLGDSACWLGRRKDIHTLEIWIFDPSRRRFTP